jgi:hypothetical protein
MAKQIGDVFEHEGDWYKVRSLLPDGSVKEAEVVDPPSVKGEEPRSFGERLRHGLTTNEPTQGVAGVIGRAAPATVGGLIGGTAGGPLGAGAGGAAGESWRQALVSAKNPQERMGMSPVELARDVVEPVVTEGVLSVVGDKAARVVGAGVKAARNAIAPQVSALLSKVPVKYTEPMVKGKLKNAPTLKEAGAAYEKALEPLGIKGLDVSLKEATGKTLPTAGDFARIVEDAAKALDDGTLTPQQALWARQAVQKIQQQAKLGRDEYAGVARQLDDLQGVFDDYLGGMLPEFAAARKTYATAKAASAFDNWLPRNKDGTPDVARSWGTTLMAPYAWPVVSPKAQRFLVEGADTMAPAMRGALKRAPSVARHKNDDKDFYGIPEIVRGW